MVLKALLNLTVVRRDQRPEDSSQAKIYLLQLSRTTYGSENQVVLKNAINDL